jgi:pimeloyl-ACP methyl ester carboxylesterase
LRWPPRSFGHSFGSLIVRSFAALYNNRIAGMVHVDGSKPALALWPGDGPIVDGHDAHATVIDAASGAVELSGASLPDVPAVVVARTPDAGTHPEPTIPLTGRCSRR